MLVSESRISSMAKRTLIGLIEKPNKTTINVDGMKVTSKPTKDGVMFTFPADNFDISMALTDISDEFGYFFDTNVSPSKQHMTFEIRPKMSGRNKSWNSPK